MKLYAFDQHDQLLHIWREIGSKSLNVVHVDFHCDMRGLLIDREQQCGWRIPEVRQTLDEGNYLRYAIFEGIVSSVTWVHGTPGGRLFDVHTVKYTSDWSSRFNRQTVKEAEPISLPYQELEMSEWQGINGPAFLDIDWDTFADQSLPVSEIDRRVQQFLKKPLGDDLQGVAICYSRHHSHDTREQYNAFVNQMAERLGAEIVKVPFIEGTNELPMRMKVIPKPIYNLLQSNYHSMRLGLKRMGIQ